MSPSFSWDGFMQQISWHGLPVDPPPEQPEHHIPPPAPEPAAPQAVAPPSAPSQFGAFQRFSKASSTPSSSGLLSSWAEEQPGSPVSPPLNPVSQTQFPDAAQQILREGGMPGLDQSPSPLVQRSDEPFAAFGPPGSSVAPFSGVARAPIEPPLAGAHAERPQPFTAPLPLAMQQPAFPMSIAMAPSPPQPGPVLLQVSQMQASERITRRNRTVMRVLLSLFLLMIVAGGGLTAYALLSARNASFTPAPMPAHAPKPTFVDSFQNNAQGWTLQTQHGSYASTISQHALLLEDDENKLFPAFVPGNRYFGNFVLQVNAHLTKGDSTNGYGLYIRGRTSSDGSISTYYRIEFYGDGTYAIYKSAPGTKDGYTALVDVRTPVSALQTVGKENQIIVSARGSQISLIVNGQALATVTDSSYTMGSIALFVSNLKESHAGAQAAFSHLVIYPVTT